MLNKEKSEIERKDKYGRVIREIGYNSAALISHDDMMKQGRVQLLDIGEIENPKLNIFLVGISGSGKTTIAQLLGEKLLSAAGLPANELVYLLTEGDRAQLALKNEWVRNYVLNLFEVFEARDNVYLAPNGDTGAFIGFVEGHNKSVAIIDSLSDVSDAIDEAVKLSRMQESDFGCDKSIRLSYTKNRTTLLNLAESLLTNNRSHRLSTVRLNSAIMLDIANIEQSMVLLQKFKYLSDICIYIEKDNKFQNKRVAHILKARNSQVPTCSSEKLGVTELVDWIYNAISPALSVRMPVLDPVFAGWGVKDRGFYRSLIKKCEAEEIDLMDRAKKSGKGLPDEFLVEMIISKLEKNPHPDETWKKQIAWLTKKGFLDVLDEMKKIDGFSAII